MPGDRDRRFWHPKVVFASLLAKPEDQEAVVIMRAADDDGADIHIKMHFDKTVVSRDGGLGWSGVSIDEHQIQLKVDGAMIRFDADGSVVVERDFQKPHIAGTGKIFRFTPTPRLSCQPTAAACPRGTEATFEGFTSDGLVSRRR